MLRGMGSPGIRWSRRAYAHAAGMPSPLGGPSADATRPAPPGLADPSGRGRFAGIAGPSGAIESPEGSPMFGNRAERLRRKALRMHVADALDDDRFVDVALEQIVTGAQRYAADADRPLVFVLDWMSTGSVLS